MSLATQKEQVETDNRRLYPRGTIRGVVLVFFGLGKWGKLVNIGEGGMAFEFYQLPPSGQQISFGLELMGREPSEPLGDPPTDSIHADGQVVWTREFERCAGVQFVDISGGARQQIRQWLSIEAASGPAAGGEKVQRDAIGREVSGPPLTLDEATSQGTDSGQLWNAEFAQSTSSRRLWGPGSDEEHALDEPYGAKSQIDLDPQANSTIAFDRAALMSIARWVAVLAMLGAITTMILSQRVHLATLFESIQERSTGNRAPPRAGERLAAKTPLVFEVEAVDMNNRRRLLTFNNNASAVESRLSPGAAASSAPNKPFLVVAAAPPAEGTAAENRRSFSNLKLGSPTVRRAEKNASTEDPTLAIDSVVPSREAIRVGDPSGASLANTAVQVPVAPPKPAGGQVQEARLISSVSPAYPALARSIHLQGTVTIDALIDSAGKVAAMKPLSGPLALQQAAMDALRQWNYEPARLDGQPVSTHLSVRIKFRLN
jgi:TonB family protein